MALNRVDVKNDCNHIGVKLAVQAVAVFRYSVDTGRVPPLFPLEKARLVIGRNSTVVPIH